MQEFEPIIGLKLSLARMSVVDAFHFGNISQDEDGMYGEYVLHLQCVWRIDSPDGIVASSASAWTWAFGRHAPVGWDRQDGANLQDFQLGELLRGYDSATDAQINTTDKLVVERVEASQYGDVTIYLSGGYRLMLFIISEHHESWRLFNANDETRDHFVVGDEFDPDLDAMADSVVLSFSSQHRSRYCLARGMQSYYDKDLPSALEQVSEAITLDPKFAAAYYERAQIYHALKEPQRALADVDEAMRVALQQHAEFYYLRGSVLIDLQEYDEAISVLSGIINHSKEKSRAYLLRARAKELAGDLKGAFNDLSWLVGFDKRFAKYHDVYYRRGLISRRRGELEWAIGDFSLAIDQHPDDWKPYHQRGSAHIANGDAQAALKDYRRALELLSERSVAERQEMLDFIDAHHNSAGDELW